jgi:ABC-type bacteriocin/lantibiotic exporter with double-glycine peptidase domain
MEALYQLDKNKLEINKNNFIYKKENTNNVIELKNLSFKYFNSEEYIFEDINLSIKSNTHNILTGPNGSGKSTLLGLMSGVLYCQNGTVTTGHKNFGYIGATPLIFTGSLRENLLYGNDLKINDEKILSMLEEFKTFKESSSYDLERLVDNKSLSSGQMQKIAFVRALLSDIDILLLDESTANLDEYSREYIFNKIKENRITIVNSTHDPEKFLNVDNHIKIEIIEEKRVVNST